MDAKRPTYKQLGELLMESGLINSQQLANALEVQKEKGGLLGELLVELGFCKDEDIAQALTVQCGLPYLPLTNYEISPEVIKIVPARVARQYMLIPIDIVDNNLSVAMSNPLNTLAIEDVEFLCGCSVQTFVATSSDIKKAIAKYYKEGE